MDATSRRAFPLDSRTVWVEQQIIQQVLIPRDNMVLGPGEYTPKILERNISTPALGKFRTPADSFRPFSSSTSRSRNGSPTRSPEMIRNVIDQVRRDSLDGSINTWNSSIAQSLASNRTEYTTIFHNHDDRNPFDPKNHFTETPDPYLSQDTIYAAKKHDGIVLLKNTLPFGPNDVPFGERNPTKPALPEYDVQYDSLQVRPTPKLGSFPISKRIHIPSEEEMKQSFKKLPNEEENSPSKLKPVQPNPSTSEIASKTGLSVFEIRCNLVPLPKLKTRAPPRLVLDDTCYRKARLAQPLILTPSVVKREARLNLFEKIPCIPRKHKSVEFVKRHSSPQRDI